MPEDNLNPAEGTLTNEPKITGPIPEATVTKDTSMTAEPVKTNSTEVETIAPPTEPVTQS